MMNTKFAQIFVNAGKGTKMGFLSLVFTFVFLSMSSYTHAQSIGTGKANLDFEILDNYTFKKDRDYVMDALKQFQIDNNDPALGEVYLALQNYFLEELGDKLMLSNTLTTREIFAAAYSNMVAFSYNFQNPGAMPRLILENVSEAVN